MSSKKLPYEMLCMILDVREIHTSASSNFQGQHLIYTRMPERALVQDYLLSYKDRIQAVTADQVLQAAKRHLHPLDQQVVVVADAAASQKQLMMQARTVLPLKLG